MKQFPPRHGILGVGLLCLLLAGCSALKTAASAPPTFYSLDQAWPPSRSQPATEPSPTAPTLIVNPPHAAAGFDSRRILYVKSAHKLDYFSHHEWVDTPARMMLPLIIAAIDSSGRFRAVLATPSSAMGELKLDTEILRLEQDFTRRPSRVHFTLRAVVVDNRSRKVLGWREFDAVVAADSDDPYGGVVAATQVVHLVLSQLAGFCAETAGQWQATPIAKSID